jgi:RNA polymerase sigma-70 factor (ECF subfamily)
VLQEAYLKAWRGIAAFREDARLSTWLVRIVINEALGRLRRRDAQVVPLDASIGLHADAEPPQREIEDNADDRPDRMTMRTQLRALMEQRIDALPEAFRTGPACTDPGGVSGR